MMPVKADLAIFSSLIGVYAWIVQEFGFHVKPLMGYQFLPGFCKSSHICGFRTRNCAQQHLYISFKYADPLATYIVILCVWCLFV